MQGYRDNPKVNAIYVMKGRIEGNWVILLLRHIIFLLKAFIYIFAINNVIKPLQMYLNYHHYRTLKNGKERKVKKSRVVANQGARVGQKLLILIQLMILH